MVRYCYSDVLQIFQLCKRQSSFEELYSSLVILRMGSTCTKDTLYITVNISDFGMETSLQSLNLFKESQARVNICNFDNKAKRKQYMKNLQKALHNRESSF